MAKEPGLTIEGSVVTAPNMSHRRSEQILQNTSISEIPTLIQTSSDATKWIITHPEDITGLRDKAFQRAHSSITMRLIAHMFGGDSFATATNEQTSHDTIAHTAFRSLRGTSLIERYTAESLSTASSLLAEVGTGREFDVKQLNETIAASVALKVLFGCETDEFPQEMAIIVDGLNTLMLGTGILDGQNFTQLSESARALLLYNFKQRPETLNAIRSIVESKLESDSGNTSMITNMLVGFIEEKQLPSTTQYNSLSAEQRREFIKRVTSTFAAIYTAAFGTVTTTMTDIFLEMDSFEFDRQPDQTQAIFMTAMDEIEKALHAQVPINSKNCPHWAAYFEWRLSMAPPIPLVGKQAVHDTTLEIHDNTFSDTTRIVDVKAGTLIGFHPSLGVKIALGKDITSPQDFLSHESGKGIVFNDMLRHSNFVFGLGVDMCKGIDVAYSIIPSVTYLMYVKFFQWKKTVVRKQVAERRVGIAATYVGPVVFQVVA